MLFTLLWSNVIVIGGLEVVTATMVTVSQLQLLRSGSQAKQSGSEASKRGTIRG